MKTSHEAAFDAFSAFAGGLACFEFIELMDSKEDKRCASARLSQFVKEGLAERRGLRRNPGTGLDCVAYIPTGRRFSERILEDRDPRRKRRRPTTDELKTLRRWKADAIARFPELGVDPLILRARKQVASILRDEGSEAKAALVERGELDDGETMRIVLSIMRAAA